MGRCFLACLCYSGVRYVLSWVLLGLVEQYLEGMSHCVDAMAAGEWSGGEPSVTKGQD